MGLKAESVTCPRGSARGPRRALRELRKQETPGHPQPAVAGGRGDCQAVMGRLDTQGQGRCDAVKSVIHAPVATKPPTLESCLRSMGIR